MKEGAKVSRLKPGEVEQEHRVRHQESQPSFDKLHGWESSTFSIGETPFLPRMDKHAAWLARARSDEHRASIVLQLQRVYGNRYVQRLIESMGVQAKLTVSAPNDVYEQEADRVADAVTRGIASQAQRQEEEEELQAKPILQRQVEEEEEEEEEVMPKPASDIQRQEVPEEEEEVQMQPAENQPAAVSEGLETRINAARGNGQPLSEEARVPMEQSFGADFSSVRVHTDSEADALNQNLSARAFTTGQDIFFKDGEYSPGSDSGLKLIAHELTHVIHQSSRGGQLQTKKLSDYAIAKAAMGVVRFDAPTFSHIENAKWLESTAIRRIKWELTEKEKEGGWDKEDVQAIAEWVADYARRFRELTDLYKVVGMLAEAAGEKGESYNEQVRNIKWHPITPEAGPPTIVFGPAPSRGFYDSKSHSIQIDVFKHETALDVLDTILFECINVARTAELNKDIEGIEEYGTDVVYIDKLRQIYNCGTMAELCETLGLKAYMTKPDEGTCVAQKSVPLPDRTEVSSQAARQALWHWKTEGWSEENRKFLWGASRHAPGMKVSV